MAKLDLSGAPFYRREVDPDWTEILYNPGRPLPNGELNGQQQIFKRLLKEISDTLFKDGEIIQGAQIILDGNKVTVTEGKIYVQGVVRHFKQQTVTIEGKGRELIGVRLNQKVVSYEQNPDLVDPAAGFPSYKLPGASRLEETLELTVNGADSATIYVLEDGNLLNELKREEEGLMDKILSLLARRTYDESGHYKVWGLELSQKNQIDEDNLYLSMSEGKAYVEGWEIEKRTAVTIPIEKSTTTRSIESEPKIYKTGTTKYKLNNNPVKDIDRVVAEVSVSTVLTRQGAVNGTDPIPSKYNPVVDIKKITQITDGVEYKKNEDFILETGNVKWLAGGKQPELGATYNITFTYNKRMVKGDDYKLSIENNEYYIELLENGDKPVNTTQMQIDYSFYLHYIASITMDRNGQIRVVKGQPDTANNIVPPDITDQDVLLMGYAIVAPLNDVLKIYNSKNQRTSMLELQQLIQRMEESEINQAITDLDKEAIQGEEATLLKGILTDGFIGWTKSDINHKDYNASINPDLQLLTLGFNQEVRELTLDPAEKDKYTKFDTIVMGKSKDIVLDSQPFGTNTMQINPYTDFTDAMKPFYDISVVPLAGITITTDPQYKAKEGQVVTVNVKIDDPNKVFKRILVNGAEVTGNTFTMPDHNVTVSAEIKNVEPPKKQSIVIIPNDKATITTVPANQATVGEVVKVIVRADDSKEYALNKIDVNGVTLSADTFVMPDHVATISVGMKRIAPSAPPILKLTPSVDNWIEENRVVIPRENTQVKTTNVREGTGQELSSLRWYESTGRTEDRTGGSSTHSSFNTTNKDIYFMRERTVKVIGSRFKPNQDNIVVEFNGTIVEATPSSSLYKGTGNTLKADSNGQVIATFKVPKGTRCGTVNVRIYTTDWTSYVGNAPYTANGTQRTITEIRTTTTTVYRQRYYKYVDPIAQGFSFHEDKILNGVGLYFKNIEDDKTITVQIRETDNGYPSNIILAETIVKKEDLKASTDGSVETKISFDNPVYCEDDKLYVVSVLTDSTKSEVFIEDLGERDLATGTQVVQNPYINGVLFSSSNALTWSAHQTKNLKFNLYGNEFEDKSIVNFSSIKNIDYDGLKVLVDTSVPVDTKLEWEYSSNGGLTWLPLAINSKVDLSKTINEIEIRAIIEARKNVSPAISTESIILVGYKNLEKSSYVTRNVTTDMEYKEVKMIVETDAPSGTGVVFYYATDIDGNDWKSLQQESSKPKIEGSFTEYTYKATLDESNVKNFRAKIVLTTNNTTVLPLVRRLRCIMK